MRTICIIVYSLCSLLCETGAAIVGSNRGAIAMAVAWAMSLWGAAHTEDLELYLQTDVCM